MVTTASAPAALEIDEVWRRYKLDPTSKEYRNLLVEHYLPLVKYNGERIWARLPEGVELDDLISAGVFGLMDAIDAFDMTRGVKFETYCVPRIRGAMLDELRTMDWVPRLVRSKASKLNEATKILEATPRPPPNRGRAGHAARNERRRSREDAHGGQRRQPHLASTRSGTRRTATKTSARSTFSKTRRAKTRPAASRRTT